MIPRTWATLIYSSEQNMFTWDRFFKALVVSHMLFSITTSRLINEKGNKYSIYWNVPTFQCHKYGYNFSNLIDYGITQNTADKFQGDRLAIMYDPGYYPAIIDGKYRNGGVPQEGNLSKHLALFKKDLEKAVPDPNFKGIGIIDFERWRPIYRENWASLDIYRQVSKEIEAKKYPELNRSAIEKKAARRFEKYAFSFFNGTLALAIELRPKAKWGYYAFPYCFNFTPKNAQKECTNVVKEDNNRSTWMYKTGTSIFPSVYLPQNKLSEKKKAQLIEYRILESNRIADMSRTKLSILPYIHYKYTDTHAFLSKADLVNSFLVPKKAGADGVIIWGSSHDVDSAKQCSRLSDYVERVIGPILKQSRFMQHPNDVFD